MKPVGWVVVAALAALGLIWLFQRRLIYLPSGGPVPPVAAEIGVDVSIRTADGLDLGGWFLPASPRLATVVVFNGNAGHRGLRAPLGVALLRRGFSVLLLDYRGYGGNRGAPSEDGLVADALAARAWLEARADVDPRRIVYFGESLGAAVALAAAERQPPAALVLRSPFTTLADVGGVHFPYLPVRLLLRDRYDSLERISRIDVPLLVVAGDADRIVPAGQSRALFEAARTASKRFVLLPGADHNDAEMLDGRRLLDEMVGFLHDVLAPAAARPDDVTEER